MAIGVFKFTKNQRNLLSVLFISLNMIQVATGLIMLSLSIYIYVSVAPVIYSERAEICYVFIVIGICGFNNVCCYLFSFKINFKCLNQAFKKSTRSIVFAWTCVTFYIIIYLLILAKMTGKVYKHVIRSMEHSIYIGMRKYLRDELWKITIDKIQFDLQCCGVASFKDWHQTQWLGPYEINSKSHTTQQFRANDSNFNFPVTPWSCCRVTFPLQCLHDPLQQIKSQNVWADQPALVADSLNTEGCITKLKIPIRTSLMAFVLLTVVNFVVQVALVLILRLLYTSCRNALLLGDPDGISPGWIFGRGDCGYNRGKTLTEIMDENRRRRMNESNDETQLKESTKVPDEHTPLPEVPSRDPNT